MRPSLTSAVTAIAAAQHGAISATQLRAAGVSSRAQRQAIAAGWLAQVEPTVFVLAGSADGLHRRLQVGLLALGGRGWVSHEAAPLALCEWASLGAPDAGEPGRWTSGLSPRGVTARPGPVRTPQGEPLQPTGELRPGRRRRELPGDRQKVPLGRVNAADCRAQPPLGEVLLLDTGGESILERRFLTLVREAGLPRPATQVRQRRDGRHVARSPLVCVSWIDLIAPIWLTQT